MTYVGSRSIIGPYLATLGASGAVVGIVAGLGELLGYALRAFSGILVDKTQRYWLITILGYAVNLFAVPALALTGTWPQASALILLERIGKAVRIPARDTMLSYASSKIGMGVGFGIHSALDRIGGFLGPIVMTLVLYFYADGYRQGFVALLIPALIAFVLLILTSKIYPQPENLDQVEKTAAGSTKFPKAFWFYIIACSFIAAGFADFPLLAFHYEKQNIMPAIYIPLFSSIALAVSAVASLLLGKLYDRFGIIIVTLTTLISIGFVPLVFLGHFYLVFIGMLLYGLGIASQRSLIRSVIGNMISKEQRGRAFGYFNAAFGIAWFIGSAVMGILYDISIPMLVIFSMLSQFLSLPLLLLVKKQLN